MKKFIYVVLFSFLMVGCAHQSNRYMDTDFSNSKYVEEKNKKAVVFFKPIASYDSSFLFINTKRKEDLTTTWLHFNSNTYFHAINRRRLLGILSSEEYLISFVEPGIYTLTDISYIYEKYKASNKKTLNDIAYFSVKEGDVVYLGDFMFKRPRTKRIIDGIHIIDNFDKAQKYVKSEYPKLAPLLQKKLITLSPTAKFIQELRADRLGIK